MPWGDTRTPAQKEQEAKQRVYSLLPEDGSPISWGDLKRKAEKLSTKYKLSPATLSKHLKTFVKNGLVNKKKMKDQISKRLPKTMYSLVRLTEKQKRWLEEAHKRGEEWKKRWTTEHSDATKKLATEYNLFAAHLTNVVIDACNENTLDKAHKYVNLMLEISLIPHVLSITDSSYRFRNLKFDGYPILSMVMDSFRLKAEEIIKEDTSLIAWLNEQLRLNRFATKSRLIDYDLRRFIKSETERRNAEKSK